MAKKTSTSSTSNKVTFGKKIVGKLKKKYGPKEERPKKYRGQGK
jgi:hypothetical protein